MTVTMTFCDKCGFVIPQGTPVAKMAMVGIEFDLCSACHTSLIEGMQSQGRPVGYPYPLIGSQGKQGPQGLPGLQGVPGYQDGGTTGRFFEPLTLTWTSSNGLAGTLTPMGTPYPTGTLSSVISNAVSNAIVSIGSAVVAANASYFETPTSKPAL